VPESKSGTVTPIATIASEPGAITDPALAGNIQIAIVRAAVATTARRFSRQNLIPTARSTQQL
jgi:hypothetical protein